MNKLIKIFKYILLILLFILISIFVYKFYLKYPLSFTGIMFKLNTIIMYILLFVIYIFNIMDLFRKKHKINNESKYNLITIIGIIPVIIIFIRILFDKTILSNISTGYISKELLIKEGYSFIEYNSYIIIIISILLILYRIINVRKSTK